MGKKGKKKSAATLLQQVQHTARAVRTALASKLLSDGLYAGQDQIMLALAKSDGLTPGALAQELNVRPPTITKTISRLQSQGFLTRQASANDGRQALITLTGKGADAIEAIEKSVKRTEKKALRGLDKKDIKALTKTLLRIESNLAGLDGGKGKKESGEPLDEDETEEADTLAVRVPANKMANDSTDGPARGGASEAGSS
jgi:DNA-binding MarR family transcriptional regulator